MQNQAGAIKPFAFRRAAVPLAMVLATFVAACGGKKNEAGTPGTTEPVTTAPEADAPNTEGLRIHQDLMAGAHLADVDHHGLFIDFGTPAHGKYTLGDWSGNNNSSNWAADGEDGDTTFTYVGGRGRVYFHADQAGPMVARVRLRANPGVTMTSYINNTVLPATPLTAGAFREVDLALPGDKVVAGDNYLLLTFGGATAGPNGSAVAAAIDSIRIVPGTAIPAGDYAAPTYDGLVREVELSGSSRRAITVRRPTTLSYYVHVPEHVTLGFAVGLDGQGTANVKVVATPDGGQATELFAHAATNSFRGATVDLQRFANQVVRLDFVAEGEGAGMIAWNQPALYTPNPSTERMRPARNVVVLLIDTLRADRLKVNNESTRVRTPVMDALAPQGANFTNAHSVENWTKPSVASVLTGLYPRTHRARTQESMLPAGVLMMSEHLQANHFATASFIANGYVSDRFGFKQGWDYYTNYIRENKGTDAEIVFREAGDWIEQHKSERFFAYVHTIDPHVPYDPPAEYLRMYDARTDYAGVVRPRSTGDLLEQAKRNPPGVVITPSDQQRLEALHDGEISQHDAVMGRFIERMKALGIWDDTLFIITADHGEEFRDHGSWGHGHSVYEELLHVPLFVRYPRAVGAGLRIGDSVGPVSIPATVMELTGVPPMPNVEAASLVDYFREATPVGPRVAFSDWSDDRRVITVAGRYKLIVRGNFTSTFFDLQADPREQSEIALPSRPIAVRYCRIQLSAFNGATNRARYMEANQGQGLNVQQSNTVIDPELQRNLGALGYATN